MRNSVIKLTLPIPWYTRKHSISKHYTYTLLQQEIQSDQTYHAYTLLQT